jgi:hypothetical protein
VLTLAVSGLLALRPRAGRRPKAGGVGPAPVLRAWASACSLGLCSRSAHPGAAPASPVASPGTPFPPCRALVGAFAYVPCPALAAPARHTLRGSCARPLPVKTTARRYVQSGFRYRRSQCTALFGHRKHVLCGGHVPPVDGHPAQCPCGAIFRAPEKLPPATHRLKGDRSPSSRLKQLESARCTVLGQGVRRGRARCGCSERCTINAMNGNAFICLIVPFSAGGSRPALAGPIFPASRWPSAPGELRTPGPWCLLSSPQAPSVLPFPPHS